SLRLGRTTPIFAMKLESKLRAEFMAAAASEDRPASQIVRERMRSYIAQRQPSGDYDNYLRNKVGAALASMLGWQIAVDPMMRLKPPSRPDTVKYHLNGPM
ncbi:MAG: hypothetical protein ABIR55_20530, partial [Burkholderiaceae bacterium]